MSEFINTIEVLGDEATMDAIIERTITEFKDDTLTEIGKRAFFNCSALATVELPNLVTAGHYAFRGTALTSVKLPALTLSKGGMFMSCSSLKVIDLSKTVIFYEHQFIDGCLNLKALIFRSDTVSSLPSISNIANSSIKAGTGYIYVPRALVDQYKSATNWSTCADQFRALEDYTVDGTTTGELDESKI